MEFVLRDFAAAVTLFSGILIVAQKRSFASVFVLAFVGAICWLGLFTGTDHLAASITFLLIFGYVVLVNVGIVPNAARQKWNRRVVRGVLGEKAARRWDDALRRMRLRT